MSELALTTLVTLPAVVGLLLVVAGVGRGRVARRVDRAAPAVAVATAVATAVLAGISASTGAAVSTPFVAGGPLALGVDGLSALMVVTVGAVSMLVLLFAAADVREARARFFGTMLLFVAAVLLTATATTLLALLLGWEVMGAASYALIAFWWRGDDRVGAGTTAFVTTRLGDLGLYLAAGAAFAGAGDPAGAQTIVATGTPVLALDRLAALPAPWSHLAAAGVLTAAFGKAAQLPFSFWLSRAMAGPSPVSALLHSAAMVAMGGYLLLRLHPLLAATGWAADVAAWGGALTALLMGVVALAQRDLKQLLAASTSAQLGFVVLAAGITASGGAASGGFSGGGDSGGGVFGGTVHLVAHAATKALLFLAAGAWLTALGTKTLDGLRGAARSYPLVGVTFTAGALALAGVPPLSLWATKDEVLTAARTQSTPLYATALAAAVLSALYAGKAVALVWRRPDEASRKAYDTESTGTRRVGPAEHVALVVLAAGAVVLAVLTLPAVAGSLREGLGIAAAEGPTVGELLLSGGLAVAGVVVALTWPQRLPGPRWALGWLGLEAAAHRLVVRPVLAVSHMLSRFDDGVLDAAVMRAVPAARGLSRVAARIDRVDVDGAVSFVAAASRRLSDLARRPQTGQLHQYYAQAVAVLAASVLLLLVVR